MWYYTDQKIEKSSFEEQFLSRDIALTIDAMQASPNNLRYFYYIDRDINKNIIFSKKENNQVIVASDEKKFGYYPFMAINGYPAENTIKKEEEKKHLWFLKTQDDFEITNKLLKKNLLYIAEEDIDLVIPREIFLDPIYYETNPILILDDNIIASPNLIDYQKQLSEINADIANKIYSELSSSYTVLHSRTDTKTGGLLSILDEKRKDEDIVQALRDKSNFIITIDTTISLKNKNIVKIFYHSSSKESKTIGIKILNKLSSNQNIKLDGVSLVPISIEDEERYKLMDKSKIIILIEIGNRIEEGNKLSLKENRMEIANMIIGAIKNE